MGDRGMLLTTQVLERIERNRESEPWRTFEKSIKSLCDKLLDEDPPRSDETRSSWMLVRARFMQRALVTLSGYYRVTGDKRYAEKALFLLGDMMSWDSWCMNGQGGADRFRFDLATAELAVALAFTLDWLGDEIPGETREKLLSMINERIFDTFVETAAPGGDKRPAWWYNGVTNWNSVCCGGAACLAYYLAADISGKASGKKTRTAGLAHKVIELAEKSLDAYIGHMHSDGSNEEGVSYWMYGMMFLLYAFIAYEKYTGRRHRAFELDAVKNGLRFYFDMTVGEDHISFSDNGETSPVGILYLLAERVENPGYARELTRRFMQLRHILENPPLFSEFPTHIFWVQWASEIFMLLLCPEYCRNIGVEGDAGPEQGVGRKPLVVYPNNGWGVFSSDDMVLSFRSGTTNENHAMHDLNSIQLARKGTILLRDMRGNPYPAGWFGKSRELFPESNTQGKNSMLFNGIGQLYYTDAIWGHDDCSMWSDAAPAYPDFVKKALRRVSLDESGFVVTDDFESDVHTWHEIRFISYGSFTKLDDRKWNVEKDGVSALLEFESDVDFDALVCDFPVSIAVRTMPRMLRVFTRNRLLKSRFTTKIKACQV